MTTIKYFKSKFSISKIEKEEIQIRVNKSMPLIIEIELTKGKPTEYFQTVFGKMEIELCKMKTSKASA